MVRRDVTLGTVLERLAAIRPDRILVHEAGREPLTVAEAADRVARWAGAIAARAQPGQVVVVATPNSYDQLLLCLAASRAGAVAAPVNAHLKADELEAIVADAGAALVVRATDDLDPHAEPLTRPAPAEPTDLAALFYTSGTTGRSKGVEQTHRALLGQVLAGVAMPTGLRRDLTVMALPIAHIMGFVAALGFACAGVPVRFLPDFDAGQVLDEIESRRATMFIGVPAMYRMLLEAGADDRDLRSIRLWMSGADAMPAELATRFKKLGATAELPLVGPFGEAAFVEGYGMVETGGGVAAKVSLPFLPGGLGDGMGVPLPGYKLRIVDDAGNDVRPGQVGELLVRGPGVTRGYRGDAEATGRAVVDGWLHTGDLARRGPLGLVVFEGRKKDVIKVGGYSVYALEVEQALEEHPDVLEAAVVGLPHDRLGEVPAAAVRLRDGAALDGLDLPGWAAERLASYKAPRRFVAVGELPRTGTRKVRRAELAALFDGS